MSLPIPNHRSIVNLISPLTTNQSKLRDGNKNNNNNDNDDLRSVDTTSIHEYIIAAADFLPSTFAYGYVASVDEPPKSATCLP